MKTKIIAIEGVDGVGKSTLCNLIKSAGGKIGVAKTPYGYSKELISIATKEGSVAKFLSYFLTDIFIPEQFKGYQWLVLDRYILSTLVYHRSVLESEGFNIKKLLQLGQVHPSEYTIVLNAHKETIKERLKSRMNTSNHDFDTDYLNVNFYHYRNQKDVIPYLGNIVEFDSESEKDLFQIRDYIISIMQ